MTRLLNAVLSTAQVTLQSTINMKSMNNEPQRKWEDTAMAYFKEHLPKGEID
jgi:hypothetical protein